MKKLEEYILPFKPSKEIKRATAPAHRLKYCHAIDWDMPEGTPIYAARSGVVLYRESRHNQSYSSQAHANEGNFLEISNENEITQYAHFKWRGIIVKKGQKVKKGQLIGYSGRTGFASYPHLHFAVWQLVGSEYKNIRPRFSKSIDSKFVSNKTNYRKFVKFSN
jgi:murein DD-endopeptidase MepM/ murein hydrolase activator NlpD